MLNAIFRSIFGTKHERDVKRMRPVVATIAALEPGLQALSDDALRARTPSCGSGWPTAPRWTTCCPKPSRWSARPRAGPSTCATSTSR
jgi:hypothetical protein